MGDSPGGAGEADEQPLTAGTEMEMEIWKWSNLLKDCFDSRTYKGKCS